MQHAWKECKYQLEKLWGKGHMEYEVVNRRILKFIVKEMDCGSFDWILSLYIKG